MPAEKPKVALAEKVIKIQTRLSELVNSDQEYHSVLRKVALNKPWRPRPNLIQNIRDQFLHMLYGALLIIPLMLMTSWKGAFLTGLIVGTIREIEQYFNQDLRIKMYLDRVIDILFFALGSALIYHILFNIFGIGVFEYSPEILKDK